MGEPPQTATKNWPPENQAFVKDAYHENQLANLTDRPTDRQNSNGLPTDLHSEMDCRNTPSLFPKTFVINGLQKDCESMHPSVVHSEEEFQDHSSLSAGHEEDSNLTFSNECNFEYGTAAVPPEKGMNLKGRSRRKPQYSLSKTELYNNSVEEDSMNTKAAVCERGITEHTNNHVHENFDFQIRKCMQRIKPEYFQVSPAADVLCQTVSSDDGELSQKNEYQCKECHVLFNDSNSLFQHICSHQHDGTTDEESSKTEFGRPLSHYCTSTQQKDTSHLNQNDLDSMHIEYLTERDPQVGALKVDNAGDGEEAEQMSEVGQLIKGSHEHDERNPLLIGHLKGKRGRKKKIPPSDDPSTVICSVCSKAFKTRNNLKTHLCKFHSDRKDVIQEFLGQGERMKEKAVCVLCGKFFISKSALLRHMDTRHVGEKFAKCGVCSEVFENENLLSEHVSTHSKDRNKRNPSSSGRDHTVVAKENPDMIGYCQTPVASGEHLQRESTLHQVDQSHTISPHEIQSDVIPPSINTQGSPKREQNHSNQTNRDQSDPLIPDRMSVSSEDKVQTSHYFQKDLDMLSENGEKSKDFQCSACRSSFNSLERFVLHCMGSSECWNSRECPVCQKLINSSLKEHLKSHSGEFNILENKFVSFSSGNSQANVVECDLNSYAHLQPIDMCIHFSFTAYHCLQCFEIPL